MIAIFPEIYAAKDPVQAAQLTRQYFDSHLNSVTTDVRGIIKQSGVHLEDSKSHNHLADILVKDEKGQFEAYIFIRSNPSQEEENFLIAHCLGLYFLNILPSIAKGTFKTGGYSISESPLNQYIQQSFSGIDEQQASRFAIELLLPEEKIKKAYSKIQNLQSLSEFFKVSQTCIRVRLQNLGLIPKPKNLIETQSTSEASARSLERIRALAQKIDHSVKT